jgi:hypothetical protein
VRNVNTVAEGQIKLPPTAAWEKFTVKPPETISLHDSNSELEAVLIVSLQLAEATSWAKIGHEIASFQHQFLPGSCGQISTASISSLPTINKTPLH